MKLLKTILAVSVGELAMMCAAAAAAPPQPAPIDVMILGTYHFDSPGLDLNNVEVDDVLVPRRQAELEAVAAAIVRFRPTKVMIERQVGAADLVDTRYADFGPADLAETRDERVQLGYRIARAAGLTRVYGIDEQPADGEPDYFPFGAVDAYAKANGQADMLAGIMAAGPEATARFERMQPASSIAELLADWNDPNANPIFGLSFYYGLLGIGGDKAQPGAELNAAWYLRNAKIFAKLMTVARPGDRVLVAYGAGHAYWLRHFARETPGYRNVDPLPLLRAAGRR